jgi:hypothetical protein
MRNMMETASASVDLDSDLKQQARPRQHPAPLMPRAALAILVERARRIAGGGARDRQEIVHRTRNAIDKDEAQQQRTRKAYRH